MAFKKFFKTDTQPEENKDPQVILTDEVSIPEEIEEKIQKLKMDIGDEYSQEDLNNASIELAKKAIAGEELALKQSTKMETKNLIVEKPKIQPEGKIDSKELFKGNQGEKKISTLDRLKKIKDKYGTEKLNEVLKEKEKTTLQNVDIKPEETKINKEADDFVFPDDLDNLKSENNIEKKVELTNTINHESIMLVRFNKKTNSIEEVLLDINYNEKLGIGKLNLEIEFPKK